MQIEDFIKTDQVSLHNVLMGETKIQMPGNHLVKPGRMAMANGLEIHSPYLDYRMVEPALKVPGKHKLTVRISKAIPQAVLQPLLGNDLTFRKKQMFIMLANEWFRKDLAIFAKNTLLNRRLEARNLSNNNVNQGLLKAHIDGKGNYTRLLGTLISAKTRYRQFMDGETNKCQQHP